jgi:hypothetical protein
MKPSIVIAALLVTTPRAAQQPSYDRATPLPERPTLAREAEIAMARAAAPAAVSGQATIYVAGPKGYEVAVTGSNGWGCFVQRNGAATGLFPRCDDAERVAALYPVYHLLEAYRSLGRSAADYDRAVADGLKSGTYRSPARGSLSYMLAEGEIKPHIMVSMPGCEVTHLGLATVQQMSDTTLTTILRGIGDHDCELVVWTPPSSVRKHGMRPEHHR